MVQPAFDLCDGLNFSFSHGDDTATIATAAGMPAFNVCNSAIVRVQTKSKPACPAASEVEESTFNPNATCHVCVQSWHFGTTATSTIVAI